MRITCPNCRANYAVPDHLIAGRSRMRCARCGESWALAPPDQPAPLAPAPPMPAEAIGPGPTPLAADASDATPIPQSPPVEPTPRVEARPPVAMPLGLSTALQSDEFRKPPVRLPMPPSLPVPSADTARGVAWSASLFVVFVCVILLFANHDTIARAWPPMARLYALFGLI